MKLSFRTGLSFGSTSGVITTLGLIIGLDSSTHSRLAVVGGILTIALADAFSDALGVHISQEARKHSTKAIWESTVATFLTKLIFALTFLIPVLLFDLPLAVVVSIIWGLLLLGVFSYRMALNNKDVPWKVVGEHLLIAVLVMIFTHYLGDLIRFW